MKFFWIFVIDKVDGMIDVRLELENRRHPDFSGRVGILS